MENLSIIVVDDHKLFREGFCKLLSDLPYISEVHQAENGLAFIRMLNSQRFDIVFMDIAMPLIDGLKATSEAVNRFGQLNIIALTMHGSEETFKSMIEAGCKGYMLKSSSFEEITNAIQTVYEGELYVCSELQEIITNTTNEECETNNFTNREMEIIHLIAKGQTSQSIADSLGIRKKTVDKHRENIFIKTNVNNSIELVMYAIKNKIIDVYEMMD